MRFFVFYFMTAFIALEAAQESVQSHPVVQSHPGLQYCKGQSMRSPIPLLLGKSVGPNSLKTRAHERGYSDTGH